MMYITIVQPLLAREQLTWEQVRALLALQQGVKLDYGHHHLSKKKETSRWTCLARIIQSDWRKFGESRRFSVESLMHLQNGCTKLAG